MSASTSSNGGKYTFRIADLTKLVPGQAYLVKSTHRMLGDPGLVNFKEIKADGMIVFEQPNPRSAIVASRNFEIEAKDIAHIERNPRFLEIYTDKNPNESAGGRRRRTRRTRRSRHTRRTHRK